VAARYVVCSWLTMLVWVFYFYLFIYFYFIFCIEDIPLCLMSDKINKLVISCHQTQQYIWLFLL